MNGNNLQKIAERVRGIGRELLAIANQIEAEAPHLSVNLPRDLFSDLDIVSETQTDIVEGNGKPVEKPADGLMVMTTAEYPVPERRHYQRNGKRMQEHLVISTPERVGRALGFCSRSDIERSIARMTGRSREDVREAVNRIAERMQITCVKSNSYRYYPKSQRGAIINASCEELERI